MTSNFLPPVIPRSAECSAPLLPLTCHAPSAGRPRALPFRCLGGTKHLYLKQADIADEDAQSQEMFGILLIVIHIAMVIAIIAQAVYSMQVQKKGAE